MDSEKTIRKVKLAEKVLRNCLVRRNNCFNLLDTRVSQWEDSVTTVLNIDCTDITFSAGVLKKALQAQLREHNTAVKEARVVLSAIVTKWGKELETNI